MNGYTYILVDKKPVLCSMDDAIGHFLNDDYTVDRTKINDEIIVSTRFYTSILDLRDGRPLLFKTLILGGRYNDHVAYSETWEEAEETHKKACETVRETL